MWYGVLVFVTTHVAMWPTSCTPFCNCGPDQTSGGGTMCENYSPTEIIISPVVSGSSPVLLDPKDFVYFYWDPGEDDRPRRHQLAEAPAQRLPWREYARVRH